jgi:hypothetical protein
MKWFAKFFGRNDYSADEQKFADPHLARKGPRGMMMLVGRNRIFQDAVYISIPETLASNFPGYEPSDPPSEPELIGLYGDPRDLSQHIKQRR